MKTKTLAALVVMTALISLPVLTAVAEPTEGDIQGAVKDISTLDYLIKDQTPADTAITVQRVIVAIQGTKTLSRAEKRRLTALVVARAVAYKPEQAADMMGELVTLVTDVKILPIVVAAAIVAAGGDSVAVYDAMAARFKDDKPLLKLIQDSANAPVEPLTPPVVKDIQDMIREMRRAAVPTIPAQEPTTVPLVPPIPGGRYPGQ